MRTVCSDAEHTHQTEVEGITGNRTLFWTERSHLQWVLEQRGLELGLNCASPLT